MIDKNKADFSNYNTVRMREAIRYLTPKKFKLFLKIPFLLHINGSGYPGFIPEKPGAGGIYNFQKSGFYKLAIKENIFPKSIQEYVNVKDPCILSVFHIGSLGTFTQSSGSDFDYWVMIDQKHISEERYANLEKKFDAVVKYCRETYNQEVSFFIMDHKQVKHHHYTGFDIEETIAVPRIFLKEEFYRTYLMIAGKIPLWSVLPLDITDDIERQRISTQILSIHEDIIDLGQVDTIPFGDILKGLLWHICKSVEDPVKALIKATMVFSYGFGTQKHQVLLCDKIKIKYQHAGIDDYTADPYKVAFDRILDFQETCDPDNLNLIKNAIFFRLCGYPNVTAPVKSSPKHQLLAQYIRNWKLKSNQVSKLLSYASWSESEKLLLEKAIIQRLAQMYNFAVQNTDNIHQFYATKEDTHTWTILKNKTRMRLQDKRRKINVCSTYLKKQKIIRLDLVLEKSIWKLSVVYAANKASATIFSHNEFVRVFGWIIENQLYRRHMADLQCKSCYQLFEFPDHPLEPDSVYLAVSPVKPISDEVFASQPITKTIVIFLFFSYQKSQFHFFRSEILMINSWGEVFTDVLQFDPSYRLEDKMEQVAQKVKENIDSQTVLSVYQFSEQYVPDIVYELKNRIEDVTGIETIPQQTKGKPYLDRL